MAVNQIPNTPGLMKQQDHPLISPTEGFLRFSDQMGQRRWKMQVGIGFERCRLADDSFNMRSKAVSSGSSNHYYRTFGNQPSHLSWSRFRTCLQEHKARDGEEQARHFLGRSCILDELPRSTFLCVVDLRFRSVISQVTHGEWIAYSFPAATTNRLPSLPPVYANLRSSGLIR